MGNSNNGSLLSRRRSMALNNSSMMENENEGGRYYEKEVEKVPNAQVNQDKLKVILQQLKKIDRNSIHTSR